MSNANFFLLCAGADEDRRRNAGVELDRRRKEAAARLATPINPIQLATTQGDATVSDDDRRTSGTTTVQYEGADGKIVTSTRTGTDVATERNARRDVEKADGKTIGVERSK